MTSLTFAFLLTEDVSVSAAVCLSVCLSVCTNQSLGHKFNKSGNTSLSGHVASVAFPLSVSTAVASVMRVVVEPLTVNRVTL